MAQSGGPTAVINASVAGVVAEALNHNCIEEVYGGLNGVLGILNEEFIDLAAESQQQIRALRCTPGRRAGHLPLQAQEAAGLRPRARGVQGAQHPLLFLLRRQRLAGHRRQDLQARPGAGLRTARHRRAQDHRQRPARHRPLPRLRQRDQVHLRDRARTGLRQRGHGPERPRLDPRGHGPQRRLDRRGRRPRQAPRPPATIRPT